MRQYTKKLIRMAGAQPILHVNASAMSKQEADKLAEALRNAHNTAPIMITADPKTTVEYIRYVSPKRNRFLLWRKSHKK